MDDVAFDLVESTVSYEKQKDYPHFNPHHVHKVLRFPSVAQGS
jgi:hypothetical protein